MVYSGASKHYTYDGSLHIRFTTDYGTTWTAEDKFTDGSSVSGFPMTPTGSATDAQEGRLILAPNGDLLLHMWHKTAIDTTFGTYQSRSTDGGKTWSTPAAIDFTNNANDTLIYTTDDYFVVGSVIYLGARQWSNAAEDQGKCIFVKSTDNGVTWDYLSDITTFTLGSSEVGLEYLGNDFIVAVLRNMTTSATYKAYSHDRGLTWSNP